MTDNAVTARNNNSRKRERRGYTLVEIALVLTVFLMLSSSLAVHYMTVRYDERNNDAERAIKRIHTAIADYAARNRTQSFLLRNTAANVSVVWRMPGDRPHLPCPDISGDGYEDRIPLPPGNVVITLDHTTYLHNGACYAAKGLVPWKTLDTDTTDPWGGRYSYRVDYDYAHALIGFGERSRASQAADGVLLTVHTTVVGAVTNTFVVRPTWEVSVTATDPRTPFSVVINGVTLNQTLDVGYVREPNIVCSNAPCPPATAVVALPPLEIGNPTLTITITNNADPVVGIMNLGNSDIVQSYDSDVDWPGEISVVYRPGAVIYGVPVVVLSHGKNQYGAVRGERYPGIVCYNTPAANLAERQNAFRIVGLNSNISSAVYNCPQTEMPGGHPNGFVHRPIGVFNAGIEEYDDIVGWMSSEDLLNEMRARFVFPINKPPPAGLEDY